VRYSFECGAQLVNIKNNAPIDAARPRHAAIADEFSEFRN
jgi:hypothetical protein